jgi:hypothetical protein
MSRSTNKIGPKKAIALMYENQLNEFLCRSDVFIFFMIKRRLDNCGIKSETLLSASAVVCRATLNLNRRRTLIFAINYCCS